MVNKPTINNKGGSRSKRSIRIALSDGTLYTENNVSNCRHNSWVLVWEHFSTLKEVNVLEIGPRYSRWALRRQLEINGCDYYSVTARGHQNYAVYPPKGKISNSGNFVMNTSELTNHFEEEYFDVIIGIQSFEHWTEVIGPSAYEDGIDQCYRLLKPSGQFMQEVPVSHHGASYFKYEKWAELDDLFKKDRWSNITVLEQGREDVADDSYVVCKHSARGALSKKALDDFDKSVPDNFIEVKCVDCCWNALLSWQKL